MSASWPMVRLGDVLRHRKEFIQIDDGVEYVRPRVQLHAQGIVLRDRAYGSEIKTKRQQICRAGQFLVAEIDAKAGGFGLVPSELGNAIVSSHYFLYDLLAEIIVPDFFGWFIRTSAFKSQVTAQGSTNYAAIRPHDVLGYSIPLPPLEEQRRIVARIEEVATRVESVRRLQAEQSTDIQHTLNGMFSRLIADAPLRPMSEIAPQVRRSVDIDPDGSYPELGIRSFGKGTFHKPSLTALEIGDKRVFRIEPGDLVFSNVFAWEGAIAVVQPKDAGRVGSHRYITCLVNPQEALADFLCFYFLTPDGLEKIRAGSPGGAGRNRTLGLSALDRIEVPVPSLESQREFCKLMHLEKELRAARAETDLELGSMIPSVLSRAFLSEP